LAEQVPERVTATATFTHPPIPELPWTEEIVARAVGRPFTLGFAGPLLGKVTAARLLDDGSAEFEVEMCGSPAAVVNLRTETLDEFSMVPVPAVPRG
jgi:hypothetical protein